MNTRTQVLSIFLLFITFFSSQSSAERVELVTSLNINQATGDAMCGRMVEYQKKLYFCADDGTHGQELYVFDSLTQKAVLAADIHSGTADSSPNHLYVFNDKLYFAADDGTHGKELYVYDADTKQARLIVDIYKNSDEESKYSNRSYIRNFTEYNNKLYFAAEDGVNARSIYEYDDEKDEIDRLEILPSGVTLSTSYMTMTVYADDLYFTATTTGKSGYSVHKVLHWQQGDSSAGELSVDLNGLNYHYSHYLSVREDKLYFVENHDEKAKLHSYSAETNQINLVVDYELAIEPVVVFKGDTIYFTGRNEFYDDELFKFDEITNSLTQLTELRKSYQSFTDDFLLVDDKLYFSANISDSNEGKFEIHILDLNTDQVSLVTTQYTGVYSNHPHNFTQYNETFYLSALHGTYGKELFRYEESTQTTRLVIDINANKVASSPSCYTKLNGQDYFFAKNTNR